MAFDTATNELVPLLDLTALMELYLESPEFGEGLRSRLIRASAETGSDRLISLDPKVDVRKFLPIAQDMNLDPLLAIVGWGSWLKVSPSRPFGSSVRLTWLPSSEPCRAWDDLVDNVRNTTVLTLELDDLLFGSWGSCDSLTEVVDALQTALGPSDHIRRFERAVRSASRGKKGANTSLRDLRAGRPIGALEKNRRKRAKVWFEVKVLGTGYGDSQVYRPFLKTAIEPRIEERGRASKKARHEVCEFGRALADHRQRFVSELASGRGKSRFRHSKYRDGRVSPFEWARDSVAGSLLLRVRRDSLPGQ